MSNLPPIILLGAITFLMLLTTQFLMNLCHRSGAAHRHMLRQAAGINPLAGAMSVSVCASGAFVNLSALHPTCWSGKQAATL